MEKSLTDNALVSVVVPAYNHAKYIAQTIESVLNQNYPAIELIIIDDASDDDTAAIAERYLDDSRVTVHRNESNLGPVNNNNKAIRAGSGKYLLWLHGDDYLLPGHISDAISLLEANPHCDLAYSPCYWVDEHDRIIKLAEHPGHCKHDYTGGRNEVAELMSYDNYITPSSAAIRRTALDGVSGFDSNIRIGDWLLFIQLALQNSNFIYLERASTCYRIHSEQDSQHFYRSERPLWGHIGILETILIAGQAERLSPRYTQIQEQLLNRVGAYSAEIVSSGIDRLKSIQTVMTNALESGLSRSLSEKPLISVIITTRNQTVVLHNTLVSLCTQSYTNWEAIIVNDAGYDVSGLIDRVDKSDKIKYINLSCECGESAARNAGLRFAKGELICYLDEGDTWSPDHLDVVKTEIQRNNLQAVYTQAATNQSKNESRNIPLSTVSHRIEILGKSNWFAEGQGTDGAWVFVQQLANITDLHPIQKVTVHRGNSDSSVDETMLNQSDSKQDEIPCIREENPLISIIVPTYNRPHLLKNALESIVSQDYSNWEAIVVNDAGEDAEVVALSADPKGRIVYISHDTNKGLSAARNTGIANAKGEVICYLDDDDVFLPMHIKTLVNALLHSDAGVAYTDSEHVLEEEKDGVISYNKRGNSYQHEGFSIERLHIGNYIPVNTIAHYRTLLDVVGTFDAQLSALEDWDLLLRLSRVTKFIHVPFTTVEVRVRESDIDNMSVRERKNFPLLYRKIYDRYDSMGNAEVQAQRVNVLKYMDETTSFSSVKSSEKNAGNSKDNYSTDAITGSEQKQEFYDSWVRQHSITEGGIQLVAERMLNQWKVRPSIHLIVRVDKGQENSLSDLLSNLGKQFYQHWSLTVVSDMPCLDPIFNQADMLEWCQTNGDNLSTMNSVLSSSKADWTALIRADDRLEPQLLLFFADYINLHPEWVMMYCDEDQLGPDSARCNPRFKPDINIDLLRSTDYAGWFTLARTDAINASGGFGNYPGYENHDLVFKLYERYGKDAIGHISDVLYHSYPCTDKSEAVLQQVVKDHLTRSGVNAKIEQGFLTGTCRVVYQHTTTPMVSIIIPTRDKLEYIQPCVNSVLEKTDYPNYEILIVDNNSEDPDVLDYFKELTSIYDKVRILEYPDSFNYAAICNLAAREARGEYLLQLNNDTEIIQSVWLTRMMQHALRDEVGIVGARLVFPGTGKIQHAGLIMGIDLIAERPFCGLLDITEPGYMDRAQLDQNYSAVTGACLLIRKSVYEELGGMDENHLKVSYNDVDLCLKAGETGYLVVWTPYATVVHHGSVSQKGEYKDPEINAKQIVRFRQEQQTMFERWRNVIAHDPAYNRNLSLCERDFRVEKNIVINWDVNFHDRTRILGVPLHGGSGEYRVTSPLRVLDREALAQTDITYSEVYDTQRILTPSELQRVQADTLLLNAPIMDAHIYAIKNYKKYNDVFLVYTLDDLITKVPPESPVWKKIPGDVRSRIREGLSYCDRMIVSTEPIAHLCRNMIDDIRVIPNTLETAIWGGLASRRSAGQKPRVGWAGAQQHEADLRIIEDVVKQLADQVEWVFFGMCPDNLKPYVTEEHKFVMSYYDYPEKLASLNLDLALAPLDINPFNEAKSNLRLLEYGILGWPVICTDILPYQNAPVCRVSNTTSEWVNAIQVRINDLAATHLEGDRLRQWVLDNYILENNLDIWLRSLTSDQLWESTHESTTPAHALMR